MFCWPCMQKQRDYRNTSSETRTETLSSTKDNTRVLSQTPNNGCRSNLADIFTGVTSGSIDNAIVQPVLAYMVFALESGSVGNIKNAIMVHFTTEHV